MSYWNYSNDGSTPFTGVIGNASNIKSGSNPPFLLDDFFSIFPDFQDETIIPSAMVQMFIDMANASINQQRWQSKWKYGMGLFVAHHCTLYIRSTADPSGGSAAVIAAGQPIGLNTSESVGDVSVSTDYSMGVVPGWGDLNLTIYGVQLARMGKLVGKGGMYVW